MDIGEPQRVKIVEPVVDPVPHEEPAPEREDEPVQPEPLEVPA